MTRYEGHMGADPQLVEQARSTDPDARQKAALLVAQSTNEQDLPLMFELLGDKDWRVRKTIVDGFVRDARLEIIEGLIDALADSENAGKRNSSTEALILLGDLRRRDGFALLLEMLASEHDINVASSIVSSLGKYRDASSLPTLFRIL